MYAITFDLSDHRGLLFPALFGARAAAAAAAAATLVGGSFVRRRRGAYDDAHLSTRRTRQTQHDSRFYELRITVPESYPAVPPKVRFVSRVHMTCVDGHTGEILYSKVPATRNWNRNTGIEQVLTSLRAEMASDANRRTRQQQEGSTV